MVIPRSCRSIEVAALSIDAWQFTVLLYAFVVVRPGSVLLAGKTVDRRCVCEDDLVYLEDGVCVLQRRDKVVRFA